MKYKKEFYGQGNQVVQRGWIQTMLRVIIHNYLITDNRNQRMKQRLYDVHQNLIVLFSISEYRKSHPNVKLSKIPSYLDHGIIQIQSY